MDESARWSLCVLGFSGFDFGGWGCFYSFWKKGGYIVLYMFEMCGLPLAL